jgi:PAS domain S-box-containing protein
MSHHTFFVTDATNRVRSWTTDAAEIFGYSADEVIGQPHSMLWHSPVPVDVESADAAEPRTFQRRDGTTFGAAHRMIPLDGADGEERWLHIVHPQYTAPLVDSSDHESSIGIDDDDRQQVLRQRTASLQFEMEERRLSEVARLQLLRRLVRTQEEERRRLARDLHDHLGQQLTSLRLKLDVVREARAADASRLFDQMQAILHQIDGDIEFLAWELRPAALDEFGLDAALDKFVEAWSQQSGISARFHTDQQNPQRLPPELEVTLYRIAQEALNNVAKHSRARTVNVVLERRDAHVALTVEDDGVGFNHDGPLDGSAFGLMGMRERAVSIGGSLDIEHSGGGGTTILVRAPTSDTQPLSDQSQPIGPERSMAADSRWRLEASEPAIYERMRQLQNAVAARDEFIATLAHELRNPLSPLTFQVRLTIDRSEQMERAGTVVTPEWMRTQLRLVEQRLHRLLETLDRLLDVSRVSSGRIELEPERIDLVECVRDVVASFEAELALARCEVRLRETGAVVGLWDRLRLEQICRNLVSNAIRFGAGQPIDVCVETDGAVAVLTVRDYGIGIAADRQSAIFERFERGPEVKRSGGFGVGLWLVRSLSAAMGGSVAVESTVGRGASFVVTLPRRTDRERPA